MVLQLAYLDGTTEDAYSELLQSCPSSMVYHSLPYRAFLRDFLPPSAECCYLLALDGGAVVGALPTFLMDGPVGAVLNSLPFYGSHGGILLDPGATSETSAFLLCGMKELIESRNVQFATIVPAPLGRDHEMVRDILESQYSDQRVGQMTNLPSGSKLGEVEELLFGMYHSKTRNIVRKALRGDFHFCFEESLDALIGLHALHEENMRLIGGIAKPMSFFHSIAKSFSGGGFRIYTARTNCGDMISALLVLYYKDMVEYFVPATAEGWRMHQPLSALIHLAMRDAILEKSAKIWNWGGTWPSQTGVYHFKSRWGAQDYPYEYRTWVRNDLKSISGMSKEKLLRGYPWFYTVPFAELEH